MVATDWLQQLAKLVDEGDARGALALLNRHSHSGARYTGVHRLVGDTIRNLDTFDREHPRDAIVINVPANESYSIQVYRDDEPWSVVDALHAKRLATHPARETWRSYAGVPLHDRHGKVVATLCNFDHVPCRLAPADVAVLLEAAPILARLAGRDDARAT